MVIQMLRPHSLQKTVLVIAYNFPPSNTAGVRRTLRFIRYLPDFGWRPVVLTAREQDYVEKSTDPEPKAKMSAAIQVYRARVFRPLKTLLKVRDAFRRFTTTTAAGMKKYKETDSSSEAATTTGKQDSLVNRWIVPWFTTPDADIGWFPCALREGLHIIKRERIDLLYTSSPPHSVHLVGATLKWLTRRSWVADFRDPWTRQPWSWLREEDQMGGLRYRFLNWLEALVIRQADRVILNTEPALEEYRQFYQSEPSNKFSVITNGYDPENFSRSAVDSDSFKSTFMFTVTHTGSLYRRRDPRNLIHAVAKLHDKNAIRPGEFRVNLVGHIGKEFNIPYLVKSLRLEDFVVLTPPVSYSESLHYLSNSDLLLVIQPDTSLQVPGKIFEYIYLGKPILALTGEGATADIIRRYNLGAVVNSESIEEISDKLSYYYQKFKRKQPLQMRTQRKEALSHFHAATLTEDLATIFDREYSCL